MYTLDTNTIIYYLKDDEKIVSFFKYSLSKNIPLNISAMTEIELFGFPNLENEETKLIEDLLKSIAVIPIDSQIARIAGFIRRTYKIKIADAVISATALFTNSTLATRNTKDFKKITNLKLLKI
ncbi:MAG: type II toxin-antitoxin system VapC family toxin [Patescibacteria group bacterium]